MHDNYLKKEFKTADVNRLRNLLTKKYSDTTKTIVGFVSPDSIKDGEYDGRTYTTSNGITVIKSKRSLLLKKQRYCPCCNNILSHPYDDKMMIIHNKCFNCVLEFETKLKLTSDISFKDYENDLMYKRGVDMYDDFLKGLSDVIDEYQIQNTIAENGKIEKWGGLKINKDEIIEEWTSIVAKAKEDLKNTIYMR